MIELLLALQTAPPPRTATWIDGNDLLGFCRDLENGQPPLACAGYLLAVADGEAQRDADGEPVRFCIPRGVVARQLRDLVVDDLEANPGIRQHNATRLTILAFQDAFPCN